MGCAIRNPSRFYLLRDAVSSVVRCEAAHPYTMQLRRGGGWPGTEYFRTGIRMKYECREKTERERERGNGEAYGRCCKSLTDTLLLLVLFLCMCDVGSSEQTKAVVEFTLLWLEVAAT